MGINTFSYKLTAFSFILLFSFFHTGYAAVSYYCGMGMEMDSPSCTSCHPSSLSAPDVPFLSSAKITECCSTAVTSIEKLDTYIPNPTNIKTTVEISLSHIDIIVSTPVIPIVTNVDSNDLLPAFTSLGMSTSIFYSSFLR
jgi:hypothetical protein